MNTKAAQLVKKPDEEVSQKLGVIESIELAKDLWKLIRGREEFIK